MWAAGRVNLPVTEMEEREEQAWGQTAGAQFRACEFEMFIRHPSGDGYFTQVWSSGDRSGLEINYVLPKRVGYLQPQAWMRSPQWWVEIERKSQSAFWGSVFTSAMEARDGGAGRPTTVWLLHRDKNIYSFYHLLERMVISAPTKCQNWLER